jgi:hypothetical protein
MGYASAMARMLLVIVWRSSGGDEGRETFVYYRGFDESPRANNVLDLLLSARVSPFWWMW